MARTQPGRLSRWTYRWWGPERAARVGVERARGVETLAEGCL